MAHKYTFAQFKKQFPDDDACLLAIFRRRYGGKPTCPGCGVYESKFSRIAGRRAFACQWCGHHVYPCAGTEFEHSSTSLSLWFHAIYLMTSMRNGVSGKELQRTLGVTYKCAWRIGHQLRLLMAARAESQTPSPMSGHIEVDETYVGGKHPGTRGRGAKGKTIVFGMLERGGAIKAQVVPDWQGQEKRTVMQCPSPAGRRDEQICSPGKRSASGIAAGGFFLGCGLWPYPGYGVRCCAVSASRARADADRACADRVRTR